MEIAKVSKRTQVKDLTRFLREKFATVHEVMSDKRKRPTAVSPALLARLTADGHC